MISLSEIFWPNGDGKIGGGSGSKTEINGEEICKTPIDVPTLEPGI